MNLPWRWRIRMMRSTVVATTLLLSVFFLGLQAQSAADSIFVKEVRLIGHKQTRPGVIFREMSFGKGDYIAIADLERVVGESRTNLLNTGLFISVDIAYEDWESPGNQVTFSVNIKETWYIYPVPIFELADRNFNVWWREQGRDLNRVNIGAKFTHYNFSGQRDKLRATFQYGYTRRYGFSYGLPYVGQKKNVGLVFGANYSRRREQNYLTQDNQQVFYLDRDTFVFRQFNTYVNISYRRKLYLSQSLRVEFRNDQVVDSIAILNPFFFENGRSRQRFFRLEYEWVNDRRDVRNYPWKGSFLRFRATKEGLGIFNERNGLAVRADYRKFTPLGEKYSLGVGIAAKYSLIRSRQPFLENRAIGFMNNNLVGYQFYVVDGLDMLILRAGLRRKLFNGNIVLPDWKILKAFRLIPWRMLLSAQIDQGIAVDPFNEGANPLANNWLTGGSIGVDVVLYFDMVFGLQVHQNHLGETTFLARFNAGF